MIDIILLLLLNLFFPEKKPQGRMKQGDYTTSSLLVADSLIHDRHRDDGAPKSFDEAGSNDPFLNEEYQDGPDW
ncbi:MAG: hypothetical protein P9L97_05755 [Candidatus Tenebribacter davisii]|nr:hypothetical protein [Candidatus Tenebribacter davisii]